MWRHTSLPRSGGAGNFMGGGGARGCGLRKIGVRGFTSSNTHQFWPICKLHWGHFGFLDFVIFSYLFPISFFFLFFSFFSKWLESPHLAPPLVGNQIFSKRIFPGSGNASDFRWSISTTVLSILSVKKLLRISRFYIDPVLIPKSRANSFTRKSCCDADVFFPLAR